MTGPAETIDAMDVLEVMDAMDVLVVARGDWRPAVRCLGNQIRSPHRIIVETETETAAGVPEGVPTGVVVVPSGRGIAAATGDYVALIGDLDSPHPAWLTDVARAFVPDTPDGTDPAGITAVCWGGLALGADGIVAGVHLPPPVSRGGGPPRPGYAVRRAALTPDGKLPHGTRVHGIARLLTTRRASEPLPEPAGEAGRLDHGPAVSVVLPVRNAARTLGGQLAALDAQDYTGPWELVVVDDGSTDRSMAVLHAMRPQRPALRRIPSAGRGAGAARNAGMRAARGDLLLFCDADDVAGPGWISAMVAALEHAPLAGGALDCHALSGAFTDEQPVSLPEQGETLSFARSANCGVRRETLRAVGGWAEFLSTGEDVELSWRVQLAGHELAYAPDAVMNYRLRPTLAGVARQKWAYGLTGALLYRMYRHAGYRRRPWPEVLRSWAWMLRHLPDLARPGRPRRRWIRYAARLAGFAAGSLRHRAAYF